MILKYIDDLITCDPWIVSCEYGRKNGYMGYTITTSKNETISLLISSGEICCEDFGANLYFRGIEEGDDCSSVVGSIVKDVKFDYKSRGEYQSTNIIIETNRGTIKLLVYNDHNSYYPHAYIARFNGREERGEL
jgi:hypothetical protein